MRSLRAAFVALTLAAAGCHSMPVAMTGAADLETLERDEKRLWAMSDEIDTALRKSGAVRDNLEVQIYLQRLMTDLFPEFEQALHVQILNNPEANAFAMSNGSVYVYTGMLARLRNEAELAALLGHEGAHFTQRHILESRRSAKNMSVFVNTLGVATGIGGALASSLVAASSLSNISQSNESESDRIGLERMSALGYDANYASNLFSRLAEELIARDIDEPSMFRSHPKLSDRVTSLNALAAGYPTGGKVNAARYLEVTARIRVAALRQAAERSQGELLVFLLEDAQLRNTYGPLGEFYLAEGYRLRGTAGDEQNAVSHYERALAADPINVNPHARLGVLRMKAGDLQAARAHFLAYQRGGGDLIDMAYIEHYLAQIDGAAQ